MPVDFYLVNLNQPKRSCTCTEYKQYKQSLPLCNPKNI